MKKTYSPKKFLKSKFLLSAFILCVAFSYKVKAQVLTKRIFDNNSFQVLPTPLLIPNNTFNPEHIASGDLNGDGKIDVVIGSGSGTVNGVGIFRNSTTAQGPITFDPMTIQATGLNTAGVALADLNTDGKLDFVVANYGENSITFARNTTPDPNSPITFNTSTKYVNVSQPTHVAIGDIVGDSKPDVVVITNTFATASNPTITIYENISSSGGSITLGNVVTLPVGNANDRPNSVAIGDVDGDGKADIVVCDGNIGKLAILRNTTINNTISFTPYTDFYFDAGSQVKAVKLVDLDSDGKLDLLYSYPVGGGSIFARRNISTPGNLNFENQVDNNMNGGDHGLLTADLDGDAKPDLISSLGSNIYIKRNITTNGINTGSFTQQVSFNTNQTQTSRLTVADLDGDNKPEIVAVNFGSKTISILKNTVDVTAPAAPTNLVVKPSSTQNIIKWDANTESDLKSYEIYGGTSPAPTTSLGVVNAPITTFIHTALTNGTPYYYRITTLDNVGNESIYSTEISATPQFPPVISGFSPNAAPIGNPIVISGANFNPTAAKNIVFFGSVRATVTTASNNTLIVNAPAGVSNQPITVLNTDTELIGSSTDFFKTTFDNAIGKTFDANSFKGAELSFPTLNSGVNAKMADFNGDGFSDIVVGYSGGGSNNLSIYQNTNNKQTGLFNKLNDLQTNETNYSVRAIGIGDLDGDGKLDIVTANGNGSSDLKVFLNTSTLNAISFDPVKAFTNGTGPFIYDIEIADVDGDGKNDVIASSYLNSGNPNAIVNITRNTTITLGNITFATPVGLALPPTSTVAVKDLDSDGKPEIISASRLAPQLSISYNTSTPGVINVSSFRSPDIINLNAVTNSVTVADLNGDIKPEIIVSYPTISSTNNISIFQNTSSSGAFNFNKQDFSVTNAPKYIEVSDLDGDGKSDVIAVANDGVSVSLLRNLTASSGSITLDAPFRKTISAGTEFMSAGDLDNDGKPELFFANGSNLRVLKNYIDATAPSTPLNLTATAGNTQNTLNWAANTEADLDSYKIYAGTSPNPTTSIGTVTIVPPATTPANTYVHTGLTAGTTYYYRIKAVDQSGNESSSFSNEVSATTSAAPVITNISTLSGAIGTNLTLTGLNFNATAANNVVYFGGVKANVIAATATQLTVVVPAGATNQAISVLNTTTGLSGVSAQPFRVTFNNAVGKTFGRNFILEEATKFPTGSGYPYQVYDLDGDGKNDLLLNTSSALEIYLNTSAPGGEILVNNKFTLATAQIRGMEVGDLNGDGKLDIVLTDYAAGTIRIFINNTTTIGNLAFTELTPIAITSPDYLSLADIDGDGKLDIILGRTNSASIGIYKNITSTPTNTQFNNVPTIVIANNALRGLNVADLDGDGKPELIAPEASSLSIFKNNNTAGTISAGSFSLDRRTLQASSVHMTVADIDGDGKTDIAYHISTGSLYVLRNTTTAIGTLNFVNQTITMPSSSYRFNFGDVDGDGKLDLFVPGPNGVYALNNTGTAGNISFGTPFLAITTHRPAHVFFADLNNDGKSDLFVGDGGDSRLYRNNIDIIAPNAPTNLAATAGTLQNTLTWNANAETDLDGYEVYGGTTANPTTLLTTITTIAPATTPANTYVHTGLTAGSTYYYRIVAFDKTDNKSGYSNEVSSYLKLPQTITFNTISPVVFGAADFNPGATSTNTTIPVTYTSSNTNVATIVNGQIHVVGVGTTTITASQAGDNTYSPAANVTQQLTVTQATQTITFAAINPVVFGTADFSPGATSTNTTIPVTYTSSDVNVATIVNGQIHIVGAGTTTITANQAGNTNYSAATSVIQQLTVTKATQTITFNAIPDQVLGSADYTLNATTTSGLAVSYTSDNTNVVNIVNGKLHTVGAGTANITASQIGDQNYLAATPVVRSVKVTNDPTVVPNNILTPNGDGRNDTWDIKNIEAYANNEITIYDRAGRIVYNKKGYNNDWDGTYNGNPLEENTYYYILKLGSDKAPIKGFITLIRNNK